MSYSFTVAADSKADLNRQIREQFDNVVASQPTHIANKEASVVAAQAFVNILIDPEEGGEIYVSMNGSLSWRYGGSDSEFNAANVTINAGIRDKN